MVQKIDKTPSSSGEAIEAGTGIIITTLQKFPVIYREVRSGNKRFAVIVDEAHSSQTGDAARKLKRALADTEKVLEEYAQQEYEDEAKRKDDEDKLLDELAAQGVHENLSFFAFTATPKDKTLQNVLASGMRMANYHPFHVYSMRQAIEEGFILDVLQNYMTYNMYYKIAKAIPDDPELDTSAGVRAIRQFETLHPHNISQKRLLCWSSSAASPGTKSVERPGHDRDAPLGSCGTLPAGVQAADQREGIHRPGCAGGLLRRGRGQRGDPYTEEKLNKTRSGETIKEKALPEAFHTDEYGMLIVAEKYQTGFDEPLLHTMFVDKKLSGVKAVQTLSRLNRTMRARRIPLSWTSSTLPRTSEKPLSRTTRRRFWRRRPTPVWCTT